MKEIDNSWSTGTDAYRQVLYLLLYIEMEPEPTKRTHWNFWQERLQKVHLKVWTEINGKDLTQRKKDAEENELNMAGKEILDQLNEIKTNGRPVGPQLVSLWANVVEHRTKTHGEMPASWLSQPNYAAARGMITASSEPLTMKLEEAHERGRFVKKKESDFPMADISGNMGNERITAVAELVPLGTEAGPDAKALMAAMAERMRDPRDGIGPKTAQLSQALMATWLKRRDAGGWCNVTIDEVADMLGYSRRFDDNTHDTKNLKAVREYTDQLRRTLVRASMPALKGRSQSSQFEAPSFSMEFIGSDDDRPEMKSRPSEYWSVMRFQPNALHAKAAIREGAFLMGADMKLNQLHAQHQRADVLLGKYLERQFRMDWDNGRGVMRRQVGRLLRDGMGLDDPPSRMATLLRLENVLYNLMHVGTIKEWTGDSGWHEVLDHFDKNPKSRMTHSWWTKAASAYITLEAGPKYHEQYKAFGLTHQPHVSQWMHELRDLMAKTKRAHKLIAQDLGVTASHLTHLMKGRRKVTPQLEEKISGLLKREATLQLPFDDEIG